MTDKDTMKLQAVLAVVLCNLMTLSILYPAHAQQQRQIKSDIAAALADSGVSAAIVQAAKPRAKKRSKRPWMKSALRMRVPGGMNPSNNPVMYLMLQSGLEVVTVKKHIAGPRVPRSLHLIGVTPGARHTRGDPKGPQAKAPLWDRDGTFLVLVKPLSKENENIQSPAAVRHLAYLQNRRISFYEILDDGYAVYRLSGKKLFPGDKRMPPNFITNLREYLKKHKDDPAQPITRKPKSGTFSAASTNINQPYYVDIVKRGVCVP